MEKILETERLYIRHFNPNDVDLLAPILGDKDVMYFSSTGAMNREGIKSYLENRILQSYQQHGWGLYALMNKNDNELVGFCGLLAQIVDDQSHSEVAFRFAKKYWGQGFATEAATAVKNYAHTTLAIDELISIVHLDNTASIRVIEKVGMNFWKQTTFRDKPVNVYRSIFKKIKGYM